MSSVQIYFVFIQVIDRRVSVLCLEDVNLNCLPPKINLEILLTAVIKFITQREKCDMNNLIILFLEYSVYIMLD